MSLRSRTIRARVAGRSLGLAAFVFFLAKGLVWLALAVGGYSALAN